MREVRQVDAITPGQSHKSHKSRSDLSRPFDHSLETPCLVLSLMRIPTSHLRRHTSPDRISVLSARDPLQDLSISNGTNAPT